MSKAYNSAAKSMKLTETPQSLPSKSNQVVNSAGGYVFQVDDMTRLRRFLCLGTESGSYYVSEAKLTLENALCIKRLLETGRGEEVVKEIVNFSVEGRTAKQDPIIFALAMCIRLGDEKTKKVAYEAVGDICRIPTFLFTLIQFTETIVPNATGWGRGMRKAVSKWYLGKDSKSVAYSVTKYKQRNSWSHRDLLRLSHVKPVTPTQNLIFKYLTKGAEVLDQPIEGSDNAPDFLETLNFLKVTETVMKSTDENEVCQAITTYKLAREHVPTGLLNSTAIWNSLLQDMPLTAMIRNLGKMSAIGLLSESSPQTQLVVNKLNNQELLKKAKIHPFNVLLALKTYSQGKGDKGSLTWTVVKKIVKALDAAFYLSFKFVEPTGQRVMIALDVSGSMSCPCLGSQVISCKDASMAMSMVTAKTEPLCDMMAFTTGLVPLTGVSPDNTLEKNLIAIANLPFGGTDCALPMLTALSQRKRYDTFIVYTDNETWFGKIHPFEALKKYRKEMEIPHAKLIVVGMSASKFSIADPTDPGMLDVAGFDSAAPEVMRNFMLGLI